MCEVYEMELGIEMQKSNRAPVYPVVGKSAVRGMAFLVLGIACVIPMFWPSTAQTTLQ